MHSKSINYTLSTHFQPTCTASSEILVIEATTEQQETKTHLENSAIFGLSRDIAQTIYFDCL